MSEREDELGAAPKGAEAAPREPTFGSWSTCPCDPPCELQGIAAAQRARKRMTKRELLLAFEDADDAWLNHKEWASMVEHDADDMRRHLKEVHGCDHEYWNDPAVEPTASAEAATLLGEPHE